MTSATSPDGGDRAAPARVDIRTTRGLALALPILADDRVLVVGGGLHQLTTALKNTGAIPIALQRALDADGHPDGVMVRRIERGRPLPVARDEVAHAFVVDEVSAIGGLLPAIATGVEPGGSILVASPVPSRQRGARRVAADLRQQLRDGGAEVLATYGIRQSLTDVRHLVPLEGPALRWYVRDLYLPWGRTGAIAARWAAAVAPAAALSLIFPAVAVVGRFVSVSRRVAADA